MTASLKDTAGLVHHFLEDPGAVDKNLWVIVEDRDQGVDLARELFRLRFGDFKNLEIPFDQIPTYAANAHTGARAFILADNARIDEDEASHFETVLVTMHDANDFARQAAQQSHEALAPKMRAIQRGDFEALMNAQGTQRTPDIVVVHQRRPRWHKISPYITGAQVLEAECVEFSARQAQQVREQKNQSKQDRKRSR